MNYDHEHEQLWEAISDMRREMFGHDGTNGIRGRLIRLETTIGTLKALILFAIPLTALIVNTAFKFLGS